MSISLIMVVMAAFTTFFVNSVAFTNQQRATQVATQIANSTIQGIRALPASDLVTSRAVDGVEAQFTAMAQASDLDRPATTPSGALETLEETQTVNNIDYGVDIDLKPCEIQPEDSICTPAKGDTGIEYTRAVVTVTWTGARCPLTGCSFATSTMVNTAEDPTFDVNQLDCDEVGGSARRPIGPSATPSIWRPQQTTRRRSASLSVLELCPQA